MITVMITMTTDSNVPFLKRGYVGVKLHGNHHGNHGNLYDNHGNLYDNHGNHHGNHSNHHGSLGNTYGLVYSAVSNLGWVEN